MRSGRLRHLVTLEEPATGRATDGGMVAGWSVVDTVWAEVSDLSGREFLTAQEHHAEVSTRVVLRYRDDVRPSWRVVSGTRTLQVVAVVDPDGRSTRLELMCREVVQ